MKPTTDLDPIFLNSAEELQSFAAQPIVRAILDSLPIQLFVKEAKVTSELGRKYIFLNSSASNNALGCDFPDRDVFDSEAYSVGANDRGFKAMVERETQTLESKRVATYAVPWSPGSGQRFRVNETIEVPILLKANLEPIALLAIGHDTAYFATEEAFVNFIRSTFHEVRNMTNSITHLLERFESTDENKAIATDETNKQRLEKKSKALIDKAKRLSEAANLQSEALLSVFQNSHASKFKTSDMFVKIEEYCSHLSIVIENIDEVRDTFPSDILISKPLPYLVIIYEILRNAKKYTDRNFKKVDPLTNMQDIVPLRMNTSLSENFLVLEFLNPCSKLNGRVDVGADKSGNLGGILIYEMIQRIDPRSFSEEDYFTFPDTVPADGWLPVTMRIEL